MLSIDVEAILDGWVYSLNHYTILLVAPCEVHRRMLGELPKVPV